MTPAVVTTEKDTAKPSVVKIPPEDEDGRVNNAFQKASDDPSRSDRAKSQQESPSARGQDRDDREQPSRGDQESRREHAQNFENGRALRDSRRYRDAETQRSSVYEADRKIPIEETRIVYKSQDIYQRPVDEIDTPRFPTADYEKRDPIFAKIVNPSVKIMRVERDVEEMLDNYR